MELNEKQTEVDKIREMDKEARAQYLSSLLTPEEQKALIRRVDWRIVPWTAVLYLLNSLDRNNLGGVKILNSETKNDFLTELNMSQTEFNAAVSMFFVTYVLLEVPSNMVIKRFGPRIHMTRIIILWGISAMCMAFCQNAAGIYACRIALGIAEAGYYPGMMFLYSAWYTQDEIGSRIAWFFSSGSVAGAFAGLLASGISFMNGIGGYSGWRWVFIIEGAPSILAGFVSYFILPSFPNDEKHWISEKEVQWLEQRLGKNAPSAHDKHFDKAQMIDVFTDWHSYSYSLFYFCNATALYGIIYYLPTIIKNMGFVSYVANLMTVPPYVFTAVFMTIVSRNSDRTGERFWHLFILEVGFTAALIINLTVDPQQPGGVALLYIGAFLGVSCMLTFIPIIWAWRSATGKGTTHFAVASGLMNSIGNIGGVLGTFIFDPKWAPRFQPSFAIMIGFTVTACISILIEGFSQKFAARRKASLMAQSA